MLSLLYVAIIVDFYSFDPFFSGVLEVVRGMDFRMHLLGGRGAASL